MKKIRKILALGLCLSFIVGNITSHAAEVSYHKPVEQIIDGTKYIDGIPVYEETPEIEVESKYEFYGLFSKSMSTRDMICPLDEWHKHDSDTYYTSEDTDSVDILNSIPSSWTLKTSSSTKAKITGSTKFGFEDFAEIQMTIEISKSWGKEFSVTYNKSEMDTYTTYYLKSACEVLETEYAYHDDTIFGLKSYFAETHDREGEKHWIWDEPIAH